jgi:prophage regulatory protein
MSSQYLGAREIESWFGVSRQRVQQLIARPDWPAPCAVLAMGKIWLRDDVAAWAARHRPELSSESVPRESPDPDE